MSGPTHNSGKVANHHPRIQPELSASRTVIISLQPISACSLKRRQSTALFVTEFFSDPIWSDRCAPTQLVGPKRYRDTPLTISELPEIHAVVISHNHYDHLDYYSVKELNSRFGEQLRLVFIPWNCSTDKGK